MAEIEFTVYNRSSQYHDVLRQLLDAFEEQYRIHVNVRVLVVPHQWTELNHIAVFRQGPDLSEVYTTRVSNLAAMNASRPYKVVEITHLEQRDRFAPNYWETCRRVGDPNIWAVPWLGESYVIYYRRDLLAKAGVDEQQAFASHQALDETAAALARQAVDVPAELPVHYNRFAVLHSLASWVWSSGAEFCTQDGKRMLFDQPAFLAAARQFFDLLRHLSPAGRDLLQEHKESLFVQGKSAFTVGNANLLERYGPAAPEVQDNLSAAVIPGEHFAGGSNLVIWSHSRNPEAALELVEYLTSEPVLKQLSRVSNTIPTRLSILEAAVAQPDVVLRAVAKSIYTGRSYPSGALWGMVGEQLANVLLALGMERVRKPQDDLDALLKKHIEPLTRRINLSLSQ